MALALYRKYRPRTFAEVIGQEHVTEPLSQALRSGRLHHAYLFSGPRGCGKTSSARILARSLNCEQGPTPEPCGQCLSCRSLANDGAGSIDVIEIDAASHGGVDDARELREKAFFAPANSRFKIYVIDEAHMVSSAGFNALLKLVEEPPEYVKFIFATTEPEKVLGTIRSRTHHYPFRLIPPATLRPYLAQLCEAEGVHVDPAVFPLVVRAGGGSARDTLSVLDQLIAGAGPEGVGYARAVALLGVTDVALIDEMCDALAAGDGAAAYATIDRVAEAGHDPRRFASDLLERLRDLIVLQQVPDAVAKGLIDGPADQMERMTAQAARLGPATLSRCADIVHNGLVEMRGTTAPRLLLELITARMLLPGAEDSTGALLQRLERMERRLTLTGDPAGAPPSQHDPVVRSTTAAPPATREPDSVESRPDSAGSRPSSAETPSGSVESPPEPGSRPEPVGRAGEPAGVRPEPVQPQPAGPPVLDPAAGLADLAAGLPDPAAVLPDPAAVLPDSPLDAGAPPVDAGPAGQLSAASIRETWPEIMTMVGRRSKKIAALASGATVRDLDGQTVVLTFRFPAHARMVAAQPELLSDALYEILGGRWQIRCEVAGEGGPARSGPPTQARPANQPRTASEAGPPNSTAAAGTPRPAAPPGGQREAPPAPSPAPPGDDWPEPARPGGPAPDGEYPREPRDPPGAVASATVGPAAAGGSRTPGVTARGAGLAAARAAAAGGGAAKPAAATAWSDGSPAEEPPYDPEYDGPVRGGAAPTKAYEGFDPGDEPLDDVIDEKTARQSSEQQAMQLLQDAFGAEKIGEA